MVFQHGLSMEADGERACYSHIYIVRHVFLRLLKGLGIDHGLRDHRIRVRNIRGYIPNVNNLICVFRTFLRLMVRVVNLTSVSNEE
jgi:hypothetical protein